MVCGGLISTNPSSILLEVSRIPKQFQYYYPIIIPVTELINCLENLINVLSLCSFHYLEHSLNYQLEEYLRRAKSIA